MAELKAKKVEIAGWGNNPVVETDIYRPELAHDVKNFSPAHFIARGGGRAYGDAALHKSAVLSTEKLTRFIELDETKGVLKAEAGVALWEVLDLVIPKGWILPVIPGTQYATLGGCIAANVHGKNQYRTGDFGDSCLGFTLQTPDGKHHLCTPKKNAEMFEATLGGLGLTGVILDVTVQLTPLPSTSMKVVQVKTDGIQAMCDAFYEYKDSAEYMVGWVDHFGKGKGFGHGTFEAASHADEGDDVKKYCTAQTRVAIPKKMPGLFLNRYSMAIYNRLRFMKYTVEPQKKIIPLSGFFHPLDAVQHWNRLYGKDGLLQYQVLIPESEKTVERIESLLRTIQESGQFSYLAVVKYHRKSKHGSLPFSENGFSIALDFKHSGKVLILLDRLDKMVLEWGGKVYLAKDARMRREVFQQMYKSGLPEWRKQLAEIDPKRVMSSLMSERLGMHG